MPVHSCIELAATTMNDETPRRRERSRRPVRSPRSQTGSETPPAGRGAPLDPRRRAAATADSGATSADSASERMEDLLHVDPLELEIGFRLIGLADPTRGGDLLSRLKTVRQRGGSRDGPDRAPGAHSR